MTREQKQAARAFTSLHSPVAGKSLGDSHSLASQSERVAASLGDESEERLKLLLQRDSRHDSMMASAHFLFPTMTRQRQLHSKCVTSYSGDDCLRVCELTGCSLYRSLPILPRYRGYSNTVSKS